MFRRIEKQGKQVEVSLDGEPLMLIADIPVAAALLEQDVALFRTSPVSASARSVYCMMGNCFECVIEIDGVRQRSCQVRVRAGMDIQRCLAPG